MTAVETYNLFKTIALVCATLMLVKYFWFLLVAPLYPVKEKIRKMRFEGTEYNPLLSIIIPAWNEEVGIVKTVSSILANTYKKYEVLVVNDGSTDNTHAVMRTYLAKVKSEQRELFKKVRYFKKSNGGKGSALNHGLSKARGEIVVTIDADSALDIYALEHLITYYKDPQVDGVVGNVVVQGQLSFWGVLQHLEYLFGFYFKRSHAFLGSEYIFGGAFASFRKSVFEVIGKYDDVNKTEDIELTMRARAYGFNCTYAEDAICYTEGAESFSGLYNQRLRWKKGRFDTFIKYRRLFFSTDKKHNKWMSWFVLPYTLISDFQLFVEPIAISLLVGYSIISSDYVSLGLGILFMSVVYLVSAVFSYQKLNWKLLLLYPFTWTWFYVLVLIEFMALVQSLKMLYQGNNIVWQRWERKGVQLS